MLICGIATAKPPTALSEGRELDPVVRDFQLPEPPATPEPAAAPRAAEKSCDSDLGALLLSIGDSVLNWLTIPLGTVPPIES
jgi:hypothetical protein